MIGHAVANAVGVVAANRIGTEGNGPGAITFYGSSFVADARGDRLAELGRTDAGIALARLDLTQIRRLRTSMGSSATAGRGCTAGWPSSTRRPTPCDAASQFEIQAIISDGRNTMFRAGRVHRDGDRVTQGSWVRRSRRWC